MADDRVFKVHYQYAGPEFCNYRAVVQKHYRVAKGMVTRVEATNAEATDGWTDVTTEIFPAGAPATRYG